jgi:hypothetical protein
MICVGRYVTRKLLKMEWAPEFYWCTASKWDAKATSIEKNFKTNLTDTFSWTSKFTRHMQQLIAFLYYL